MAGNIRRFLPLLLAVFFFLSFLLPNQTVQGKERTIHYIALGNSLAAGFQNDGSVNGRGYPHFIKMGLENLGYSVQMENYGVGGFRTIDVFNQLHDPVVLQAVANADIITLDAGANDLLRAIDIRNLDLSDPLTVQEVYQTAYRVLEEVETHINQILQIITGANPDAKIYVMGYYNALPYLQGETTQQLIATVIQLLNSRIQSAIIPFQASYIPTFHLFEGKYGEYLPNPNDIHPNEAGYEAIAGAFLAEMAGDLPPVDIVPKWFTGKGEPVSEAGEDYDYYLDTITLDYYQKQGSEWVKLGNYKTFENALLKGEGQPDTKAGNIGDLFYDEKNSHLYLKVEETIWILLPDLDHLPDPSQPSDPNPDDGNGGTPPEPEQPGSDKINETPGSRPANGGQGKPEEQHKGSGQKNTGRDISAGGKLPDTDTWNGSFLVTGLSFLIFGFSIYVFGRVRRIRS
jgi:GDSL-like Lipase/Acylhydrolase.